MKMNYLLDKKTIFKNRETKKNTGKIFLMFFLILGLFIFGAAIYQPVAPVVLGAARPVLSANNAISRALQNAGLFFSSKKSLVRENNELREKLRQKETALFKANTKIHRLSGLAVFLDGLADPNLGSLVVADIIAGPQLISNDVLLASLPVGAATRAGAPVFWSDEIILGEVVTIVDRAVKIKLYSSPGVKKDVFIDTQTGSVTPAVSEGRGGGNFIIRLPRGLEISKLARVWLAAEPRLIIGIVGEIKKTAAQPFQTVYVKTPVNIYTLDRVMIKND